MLTPTTTRDPWTLRDIAACEHCGRQLHCVAIPVSPRSSHRMRAYACPDPQHSTLDAEELERSVWQRLVNFEPFVRPAVPQARQRYVRALLSRVLASADIRAARFVYTDRIETGFPPAIGVATPMNSLAWT